MWEFRESEKKGVNKGPHEHTLYYSAGRGEESQCNTLIDGCIQQQNRQEQKFVSTNKIQAVFVYSPSSSRLLKGRQLTHNHYYNLIHFPNYMKEKTFEDHDPQFGSCRLKDLNWYSTITLFSCYGMGLSVPCQDILINGTQG